MVEVIIDSQRCDLWEGYTLPEDIFKVDVSGVREVSLQRSGRSVLLELPSTPQNDALMDYAQDVYAAQDFNSRLHTARIRYDGVTLLEGVALLEGMVSEAGRLSYSVRVRSGGSDWVERAALSKVADCFADYSVRLDGQSIASSWSEQGAKVRFLPVVHDDYRVPYDETSLYSPERMMSVADYHPFLSLKSLLREAVEASGYTLAGSFYEGEELERLYMSGRYRAAEGGTVSRQRSFAGFEAGRSDSAEAVADAMGRVWLSPLVLTCSLGGLVQTCEGEGLYNNNSALHISDEGISYHPATTLNVGFEYRIKYSTDYRILSRERLKGFDAVYLGEGCDVQLRLANPFSDKRGQEQPNMEYLCVVFDYVEGDNLRMLCQSDSQQTSLGDFHSREFTLSTPVGSAVECSLMRVAEDGTLSAYEGDWALYEGHIQAMGQVTVDVTLCSPAERVTPAEGKSFNHLYLHGAEQGQSVRLSQECRLRPLFTTLPTYGEWLSFADLAAYDIRLIEVVEALQQMYNLHIYTDEVARKVYVESASEWPRGDEWDWSEKVLVNQPIRVESLAKGQNEQYRLAYRLEADGAVVRYNLSGEEPFGEWSAAIDSRLALKGEHCNRNPLFTPTLCSAPHAQSPSAQVLQVGDRDGESGEVSVRVVRYEGLRSLPEGERWGFPTWGGEYPFAAFHSPGEFTLCFEDRDGVQGLHTHYDKWLEQLRLRREVRLWVRLSALEVAALGEWKGRMASLRSTFLLNLGNQSARYMLQAVECYRAKEGCALCRFVRELND